MHTALMFYKRWLNKSWSFLEVTAFLLYCSWVYYTCVSLRGFQSPLHLSKGRALWRFAIFIPAHNEEKVVKPLLESLTQQDYPRALFDIYVAAIPAPIEQGISPDLPVSSSLSGMTRYTLEGSVLYSV